MTSLIIIIYGLYLRNSHLKNWACLQTRCQLRSNFDCTAPRAFFSGCQENEWPHEEVGYCTPGFVVKKGKMRCSSLFNDYGII